MYHKIIDPRYTKTYDLDSSKGIRILKNYINQLVGGNLIHKLEKITLPRFYFTKNIVYEPISSWWSKTGVVIYIVRRPG